MLYNERVLVIYLKEQKTKMYELNNKEFNVDKDIYNIRVATHMIETINKLSKATKKLQNSLGRDPSNEEVAKELGWTKEKVIEVRKVSREPVSLDDDVSDSYEYEKRKKEEEDQKKLDAALRTLREKERKALILRYGLEDGKPRTFSDIGFILEISTSYAKKLVDKALRKLRHPVRLRKLKDHLDE